MKVSELTSEQLKKIAHGGRIKWLAENGYKKWLVRNGYGKWLVNNGYIYWLVENGYKACLAENGYNWWLAKNGCIRWLANNGHKKWLAENGYEDWLVENGHTLTDSTDVPDDILKLIGKDGEKVKVEKQSIIYISGVSEATIQQIHELGNFWASGGGDNFCMTVENAKELPELKSLLENEMDGDVIVSF